MQELPKISERYSAEEIKSFYDAGYWTTQTLTDLVDLWADKQPDEIFVTDATSALTFGQLRERAYRAAAGLARSGIEPGDRVVIQLPNWSEFVTAVVAVARCRAIVVPIMPIYRHDEASYIVQHSGARAAITCKDFGGFDFAAMYRDIAPDCPECAAVYLARAAAPEAGALPLSALLVDGELDDIMAELGAPPGPDDGNLIIYTSGTTARPKGCFHTWNTMAFSARVIARNLAFGSKDVAFGPSPVTHGTGYMTSVLVPLFVGGKSHLMEAWDPAEAPHRIARHGCTTAMTATPFLQMLLDAHDPDAHDLSSMRLWVAAGAPIPAPVFERSRQVFPGLEVLSLYGRSENFLTTMCNTGDDPLLSTTSDGCAPPGIEIAAVDGHGAMQQPGVEGDLCYRGPGHMVKYFRQSELTAELFTEDGFSRSGDLGTINEAGYLRVTGRLKDIIIRGGMNISAVEVESLLLSHPSVQNAAVVAMPDERLGEKACAYIVPTAGAQPSLEDLATYLREEHDFAIQKLPERIELVETLPMTATGKVQKHLLRADVAEKLAQAGG
ncbi:MAG: AMP-binding protein [bacterium]|nr:cyclohexanecarboxylate-CoA ligase [Gammaproteobacteria bacterium]HIL95940.1 cyclohexanecarboxylate-CoA ligase [Pseudomonadales bacterium]